MHATGGVVCSMYTQEGDSHAGCHTVKLYSVHNYVYVCKFSINFMLNMAQ